MSGWRDDLRLKLEEFVDALVANGAKQIEVYGAIQKEVDERRAAYDRDPDPADDQPADVR
ncbi:hypothetical protein Rleg4DRAFT_1856 [Rhizobium leguminosarum bv. trifolii WSM2297]|uniref:Uncharacterized protein n=1 Tax=Rhizobium leguminosarum bv. trifolii WSM2297 TaxID=754762 RepID=J0W3G0_RHILT|nr:hypothetical protein [Rhizobium leguminosarum]EJC80236.1 hypothetical protein Rleg4DRAFT_1856 [Rhizobium leguminosarum bv. trifolii WSM2297]